jgi:hypothetical protein
VYEHSSPTHKLVAVVASPCIERTVGTLNPQFNFVLQNHLITTEAISLRSSAGHLAFCTPSPPPFFAPLLASSPSPPRLLAS